MVPTLYHLVRVLLKHSSELAQQKAGGDLKVGRGVVVKGEGRGASPQRVPQSRGFWGNGLTLNVDIAGSLLYLSMVWNLDEWLSSWYSSECLLRVCITFWKGRKEGTTKKWTKKKERGRSRDQLQGQAGERQWVERWRAVMMPAVKRG